MDTLVLFGAFAVACGLGVAAVGVGRAVAADAASGKLLAFVNDEVPDARRAELARPFVVRIFTPWFETLERITTRVMPAFWVRRLKRNIGLAGLSAWGLEGVLALKAALALTAAVVLPVIGAAMGKTLSATPTWIVAGGLIGFFGPDVWIARLGRKRQAEIRKTLPEALDLMAISVSAGVGLEGSMALVAGRVSGPLGEELNRLLQEVQLGASRRDALHALRDRTDVPELSSFVLALVQADALGSPLAEVLRVQAQEMRSLRRQRAREQAAKTPVKLVIPLLLGIFPALGVVIIGPAIISIMEAL